MEPRWEPANDVESAMAQALTDGNRKEYFRLLSASPLYLPVEAAPGPDTDEDAPQRFATWELMGHKYLIAYTSPESLTLSVSVPAYTVTDYAELREKWPVPEWRLAINPGLPLDCYLPVEAVQEAADGGLVVPTVTEVVDQAATDPEVEAATRAIHERARTLVEPDNPVERDLLAAIEAGDAQAYLEVLLSAPVLLPTAWHVSNPNQLEEVGFPWRPATGLEAPTIEMFTSEKLFLARYPADTPRFVTPLLRVLVVWPDASYAMSINPGSVLGLRLADGELEDFLNSVEDALAVELAEPQVLEGRIVDDATS